VDGYLDDAGPRRRVLSGPADLDRVDEVRAGCDAILVGAQTVRKDDPRLLIRDPRRRARRAARGLPEHPARVTLTATGDLDPGARFFAPGALRLVYCATQAIRPARARLAQGGDTAVLIDAGDPLSLDFILSDLAERAVVRLMVEGGAQVLGQFLARDLSDELHLATAPCFVADPAAPRLDLRHLANPNGPGSPMTLAEVRRLDDVVLLRYLLGRGGPDHRFLRWAIELSRLCPPSDSAFSVGAVIVSEDGEVLATGFSREQEEHDHAEEVALRKLGSGDPRLRRATIYSSLVPCAARVSRPVTCAQHIIAAGIPRVVFAWREPRLFTSGEGAEQLRAAGLAVTEVPELADRASSVNAHLAGRSQLPIASRARRDRRVGVPAEHRHVRGVEVQVGEPVDVGEARAAPVVDVDRLVVVGGHPRHRGAVGHVRTRPAERGQGPGPGLPEPRQLPGVQLTDPGPVQITQRRHTRMLERLAALITHVR
jgi:5-amino-6-(5-phosphoribosylamino)uracil reductase